MIPTFLVASCTCKIAYFTALIVNNEQKSYPLSLNKMNLMGSPSINSMTGFSWFSVANEPIDYDAELSEGAPALQFATQQTEQSSISVIQQSAARQTGSDEEEAEAGGVNLHGEVNCTTSNNSPDGNKKPKKKRKVSVKRFQLNACKQS